MTEIWTKHFDERYSSFFLHNETTGESKWDDNDGESSGLLDFSRNDSNQFILTESQEALGSNAQLVCYKRCVFINATIIEGPLVVVEGIIRILLVFIIGLVLCVNLISARKLSALPLHLYSYVREIAITFAAVLSAAVPGMVCFVYRGFSTDADWILSPLPTVLGPVDSRRFLVITRGGGMSASNAQSHLSSGREASQDWLCGVGAEMIFIPNELERDLKELLLRSAPN